MIKHISLLSLSILLSSASLGMAQEKAAAEEAPLSSDMMVQQSKIETKAKMVSDINQQVYNKANDSLMREYVRNSNAIKKMMDKPTQNVDIKDKKALSQYIQDDMGLQKEIIQVQMPTEEEKSARPRAADLLK